MQKVKKNNFVAFHGGKRKEKHVRECEQIQERQREEMKKQRRYFKMVYSINEKWM